MDRIIRIEHLLLPSKPHVRGDGPELSGPSRFLGFVNPTCVGMDRLSALCLVISDRKPHVRGDGPGETDGGQTN